MWTEIVGVGSTGLVTDQLPHELPPAMLSFAKNVRLDTDGVSRSLGTTGIGPVSGRAAPHFLLPYTTPAGARVFLQADLTRIEVNNFSTLTNITRTTGGSYTGTEDDRWTGGVLHGIALLNNGVDVPQFWAGTGNAANLTNWPTDWRTKALRPFRNFLLALGPTKASTRFPALVNWSTSADPGTLPTTWDVTDVTQDAGEFPLSDTAGEIVDGLAARESFFVYKTDAIYRCDFVGQPAIFRFSRVSDTYGIEARNCIVNTPVGQVALTAGDVVLVTDAGVRSIINQRVRRKLFAELDGENRNLSFLAVNLKRSEVLVCYPEIGASVPNVAMVWNWESDLISFKDIGSVRHAASGFVPAGSAETWATATGTWDALSGSWSGTDFGDADPRIVWTGQQLQAGEQGLTLSGSPILAKIERTGLAFGDASRVKVLRGIRPRIEAPSGTVLNIRFGAQMEATSGVTWNPPISYTVGTSDAAYGFASGRYLAYRIESSGNAPWRLRSMAFDIVGRGNH
jgi:hypothetical protein